MSEARIRTASVMINCTSRMIGADSAWASPSLSPRSSNCTSVDVNSWSIESTDSDSACSVYPEITCRTDSRDARTQSTSMFRRNRMASTDSRSRGSVIATFRRPSVYSIGTISYSSIIDSGTISMTCGLIVPMSRSTYSMSNFRASALATACSSQAPIPTSTSPRRRPLLDCRSRASLICRSVTLSHSLRISPRRLAALTMTFHPQYVPSFGRRPAGTEPGRPFPHADGLRAAPAPRGAVVRPWPRSFSPTLPKPSTLY